MFFTFKSHLRLPLLEEPSLDWAKTSVTLYRSIYVPLSLSP